MNPKLICDQCNGTNIADVVQPRDKISEPNGVKMSEYKGPSVTTTLQYIVTTHILTCKDCGFTTQYSH
jgi:hypothetical protein